MRSKNEWTDWGLGGAWGAATESAPKARSARRVRTGFRRNPQRGRGIEDEVKMMKIEKRNIGNKHKHRVEEEKPENEGLRKSWKQNKKRVMM